MKKGSCEVQDIASASTLDGLLLQSAPLQSPSTSRVMPLHKKAPSDCPAWPASLMWMVPAGRPSAPKRLVTSWLSVVPTALQSGFSGDVPTHLRMKGRNRNGVTHIRWSWMCSSECILTCYFRHGGRATQYSSLTNVGGIKLLYRYIYP